MMTWLGDERSRSILAVLGSAGHHESTTTVADTRAGKLVGKPYRGTLDIRFDEGGWETGFP